MKLCNECKHFKPLAWCVSPTNGINPVDGLPKSMFASERRTNGESLLFPGAPKCGEDAAFFSPKEIVKVKPWWRFW